jgi:periplasmic protein TonB
MTSKRLLTSLAIVAAVAACSGRRAAPPPNTAARSDPAHPVAFTEKCYSPESRKAGEEGTCIVKLTIGKNGRVSDAVLLQSAGFPRLDNSCIECARTIRFLPATINGKAVVSTMDFPVNWRLVK